MLKHPGISYEYIQQFTASLKDLRYRETIPVSMRVTSPKGHVSYEEAMKGPFREVHEGEVFSDMWSHHWFQIEAQIPESWDGDELALIFENDAEALIWQDGAVVQSIVNSSWPGASDNIRPFCMITHHANGGQTVKLVAEMACCAYWGYLTQPFVGSQEVREFKLHRVRLVRFDRQAWDLTLRLELLINLYKSLPGGSSQQAAALSAAYEMVQCCNPNDRSTWAEAIAAGDRYFNTKQPGHPFKVSAVGDAHIDTAWLWPVDETKRKCAGGFAAVTRQMDDYPEFKYSCSQALQFKWMRDLYPTVWRQIQKRVKEGRFIPIGGSWIEPDCNLPSGESLARQFLWGQRFFRQEFGITCKEFWQPDVFGYPAGLPQILQLSGISNFYTTKLWGNQFNRPVNTTFMWEGIDGTQVFTHLPPGGFIFEPESVMSIMNNYLDHDRGHETLMTFGYGDAGGAPTAQMLNRYRLIKDLPGLPDIEIRSVPEFFERCKADIKDPAVWVGELYFEEHRGTLTSHADVKRDNRRSEELLHDLEFLSSVLYAAKRGCYPQQQINDLWETVLIDQFHDILPGSSIPEVYELTRKQYLQIAQDGCALRSKLISELTDVPANSANAVEPSEERPFVPTAAAVVTADQPNLMVINTLAFDRSGVVDTTAGPAYVQVPSMGYAISKPVIELDDRVTVKMADGYCELENDQAKVVVDDLARITSFYDKRNDRELIKPGAFGNQMAMFEDHPRAYDAWNLDIYHLDSRSEAGVPVSMTVIEQGGLRGSVRIETALSDASVMTQVISLDAKSCRLDFNTSVDWHEANKMLKVEFPLDVHSDYATYEVQYGHLRRPTHYNTSWDWARFEVPAQKWTDISEPTFGVALLNDSKYGHSCHAGMLTMSLLRSPKWPDPQADMCKHWFRYALYPHAGGPQTGGVVREAMCFNQPLTATACSAAETTASYFKISNSTIVLDTVKKAEDSDDLVIRLYESSGAKQKGTLTSSLPITAANEVNILEDNTGGEVWHNGLYLNLRPFQIISYRLKL